MILNDEESAASTLSDLAQKRSYYGFLAAQRLAQPYQLSSVSSGTDNNFNDPAVARVSELLALGDDEAARLEWRTLVARLSNTEKVAAARSAKERDWNYCVASKYCLK